jgi:hypothetical protein
VVLVETSVPIYPMTQLHLSYPFSMAEMSSGRTTHISLLVSNAAGV